MVDFMCLLLFAFLQTANRGTIPQMLYFARKRVQCHGPIAVDIKTEHAIEGVERTLLLQMFDNIGKTRSKKLLLRRRIDSEAYQG